MKEEALFTRVLNTLDDQTKEIAKIGETVRRHDEITFPEMKIELKEQSKTLIRMESKQNEDMEAFVFEKEKMYQELDKRLTPLEKDLKTRSDFSTDIKKKSWDTVWEWSKLVVVFGAGYLLTIINKIIK